MGSAWSDIQNVDANIFIALDGRLVCVFAVQTSQVQVLTRFGVLNEERLLFRNQLSIEDLE
jgi:hypothetical protein